MTFIKHREAKECRHFDWAAVWMIRGSNPARENTFFSKMSKTAVGSHPVSCSVDTEFFPGKKTAAMQSRCEELVELYPYASYMSEWLGHGQLCISTFQDSESCVKRFHLDPTGFENQNSLLVLRPPTAFSCRHAACEVSSSKYGTVDTMCCLFVGSCTHKILGSRTAQSALQTVEGWTPEKTQLGSRPGRDIYTYLFSKESRLAVGPNSHPIQWVPGGFFITGKTRC